MGETRDEREGEGVGVYMCVCERERVRETDSELLTLANPNVCFFMWTRCMNGAQFASKQLGHQIVRFTACLIP